MNFRDFLRTDIVVLDGAMGTELVKRGVALGEYPEGLNLTAPGIVRGIHQEYVGAGSRVLYANTFGANAVKLAGAHDAVALVKAGIALAREAAKTASQEVFVAVDIGPTGQLIDAFGTLSFDDAYKAFAEVAVAAQDAGADLAVVETMTDLSEMRAALLAVKENTSLPVLVTMTFDASGRTFTGVLPSAFALTASGLAADGVGVNCSLGPKELLPVVKEIAAYTDLPLVVKANAGLPDVQGAYAVNPADFAKEYKKFLALGASVVGGCCGTTPKHIAALVKAVAGTAPKKRAPVEKGLLLCSARRVLAVDHAVMVGERLNPTGKKAYREALQAGSFDYAAQQAIDQEDAGAEALDVNTGVPGVDEAALMVRLIEEITAVTALPLVLDSSDPKALEAGLRRYPGRALVNSVSGDEKVLDAVLPIVKKYGAAVVGLCLDEGGLPTTVQARVTLAKRMTDAAVRHGLTPRDVVIDPLTLTVAAEQAQAKQTLAALSAVKKLGVKTLLGVSNISFGLPNRDAVTAGFLTLALNAGLDLAIMNPNNATVANAFRAYRVLTAADTGAADFIARNAAPAPQADAFSGAGTVKQSIARGVPCAAAIRELLKTTPPLEVVNNYLIPALDEVGKGFEAGTVFLPQLIAAAESAKGGFAEVQGRLPKGGASKGKIVLCTVHGDIHDIGKNIVRVVLENFGYEVVDLGRNVPPEQVAAAVVRENAKLLGLSALMTTTVANMKTTIALVRAAKPDCKIMVGGAVLTEAYAKKIGADAYGHDAVASARYADRVFKDW
ncbi:MAG: homocysteine S-methyltransferase family protein [Clostridiales bacterium]|jgi:5-methyltetrahydrofolate--homocysteine methyltransferase|nr:homocysteine S-methyltransferase family protein [Clostridiales bacterium]